MKPSQLTAYLTATDAQRRPVLVTGQPGIGKSDIVADTMAKVGRRLIITHPVTADPTDFKGLPFASPSSDSARFLPFGDLREMIDATVPTCVFIDDMGQAPPLVQAALMQLVLARRIDGHRVSDHVRFIAATNRRTDGAAVSRILEPLKSRFTIVGLEIDVRDWQVWAGAHGVPVEVIAFAQWRPELITKFQPSPEMQNSPSPRTLAAAASQIALGLTAEFVEE
jgi:MoxR-like ATPase